MRVWARVAVAGAMAAVVAMTTQGAITGVAAIAAHPATHPIVAMPTLHAKVPGGRPKPTNNLTYRGGAVETAPTVYISWWGPQWGTGFSSGGYTSAQAQTYVHDFFANVGGSSWDAINTQYCQGVARGTVNCGTAGTHITNPAGQLAGTWNDTSAVPSSPTQSQIAAAALRLQQAVGYHTNATYMVFTPTGHSMNGFATSWCAWHDVTSASSGALAYAYMPYQPDAGYSCGQNFVNANDAFGNGYFDGFSVVGGHEYAEALSDPFPASGSYGWLDSRGNEIGDKCAWSSLSGDITLAGHAFAVQPLWSNLKTGCVTS
jgi:serine protease